MPPRNVQSFIKEWADARANIDIRRLKDELKSLKIPQDIPHDKGKSTLGRVDYVKEVTKDPGIKASLDKFKSSADVNGKNINQLLDAVDQWVGSTNSVDKNVTEVCVSLYILLSKISDDVIKNAKTLKGRSLLGTAGIKQSETCEKISNVLAGMEVLANKKQHLNEPIEMSIVPHIAPATITTPSIHLDHDTPQSSAKKAEAMISEKNRTLLGIGRNIDELRAKIAKEEETQARLASEMVSSVNYAQELSTNAKTFFARLSDFFNPLINVYRLLTGSEIQPTYADQATAAKAKGDNALAVCEANKSIIEGYQAKLKEAQAQQLIVSAELQAARIILGAANAVAEQTEQNKIFLANAVTTSLPSDNNKEKYHRPDFLKKGMQVMGMELLFTKYKEAKHTEEQKKAIVPDAHSDASTSRTPT